MAWESANHDGADYFRGLPRDLKPVTIVAQALDNQWVPNSLLSTILRKKQPLKSVVSERDRFVRREFLRSFLNAENVVANRAYLFNNDSIADFYRSGGREEEAFKQLIESRVLIPFLFSERSPHQHVDMRKAFDRDPGTFEAWQEVCRAAKPSCVRLSWEDFLGKDKDNSEQITEELARPFHEYGLTANNGSAQLYAQHLGIPESQHRSFQDRLDQMANWFISSPRGEDGSKIFRQRNDFYKEFVVVPDSPVHEGWYDPSRPFSAELKRLIDLKYNTNLADAIGRFALTPADSLPRLALQENRARRTGADQNLDAEQLTKLLQRILTDLVQRQLDVPFLDRVTLGDILVVRESTQWRGYISKFEELLKTTNSWGTSGIPLLQINEHLQHVFENYAQVNSELASVLRDRHQEAVKEGFEVSYGIALSVMGQVIALVSPKGGIVFTALAELVKPHLPVEKPAQVVCKMFFRDPTQSDVLELEADMLETGLPHAREEFSNLIANLKKLGFREDGRTSLGEDEATINVGRPQDS